MAFLLLLHQKMKLQREENSLTLKQLQFSSKVDRMQKKVDKRQKYYDKLKKQIERQANCYKNSMNMQISNMFGLGTNSVNLGNMYGMNGAAMGILQNMSQDNMQTILKQCSGGQLDSSNFSETAWNLIKNGGIQTRVGENGQTEYINWNGEKIDESSLGTGVNAAAVNKAANIMQQMASAQVTQMQTQATQMKSCYENNVSIWTEAQLEQVEAQEEYEMDLLSEEQADMEAEKNFVEAKLKRVQQEKQNIEQALGQAIQDSAPKFGLA